MLKEKYRKRKQVAQEKKENEKSKKLNKKTTEQDEPYCWIKNEIADSLSSSSSLKSSSGEEEMEEKMPEKTNKIEESSIDFMGGLSLQIDTKVREIDSDSEEMKLLAKYKHISGCSSQVQEEVNFEDPNTYEAWRRYPLIQRGGKEGRNALPISVQLKIEDKCLKPKNKNKKSLAKKKFKYDFSLFFDDVLRNDSNKEHFAARSWVIESKLDE